MSVPICLLIAPQLQENIGATARAMKNFGLDTLRIVTPRDKHLSAKAYAMASGADDILDNAVIYENLSEALEDIQLLVATTSRHRGMDKPVITSDVCGITLAEATKNKIRSGILFGAEATGLQNDHLISAQYLVKIPTNPDFSSLNLAQSVLLIGYEYFKASSESISSQEFASPPATQKDIGYFLQHLEESLDQKGFFHPIEKKESTVHILKNLFAKSNMNEQEVRMLRGVIKYLMK